MARAILACLTLLLLALPAQAQLAPARDLAADARLATQQHAALLLLFSTSGCPWCERARREFLLPMQRNPEYGAKVLMREIGSDSDAALIDFSGNKTTQAQFARSMQVKLTPTVMLFGARGEVLAEPLLGFQGSDYYGYLLDQRIDAALARLRAQR